MEGLYGYTSCDLERLEKWLKGDQKAGRWLRGYFNILFQTRVGHLVIGRLHGESVSRNAGVHYLAVWSGGSCPCATLGQPSGLHRRSQGRGQSKLRCPTSWEKAFAIIPWLMTYLFCFFFCLGCFKLISGHILSSWVLSSGFSYFSMYVLRPTT